MLVTQHNQKVKVNTEIRYYITESRERKGTITQNTGTT